MGTLYSSLKSKQNISESNTPPKKISFTERLKLSKAEPFMKNMKARLMVTNAYQLTANQKEIIKSTWQIATSANGEVAAGVHIFQNIFRRSPDLKALFHLDHIENLDDLPKEESFVMHARIFSSIIDLTVRNVEDLDMQIAPAIITFGRRHFYKHQIGFRPEYMTIFALAMMDFVFDHLNCMENREATDAWWSVTVYLVTKLKQGYDLESMNKGKHKLNWPPRSGTIM